MLPAYSDELLAADFTIGKARPALTWRLSENRVKGMCDGEEALRQAAELILCTERFDYPIYSHGYGVELKDLYGLNPALAGVRLQSRIVEALLNDDRISAVGQFTFSSVKGGAEAAFTIYQKNGSGLNYNFAAEG